MALFSSKPKLQTIKQFGRTFQYMEFVKGYPLPDDVDMLKNMVSFYSNHSSCYPTKSDMQKGYIRTADYHDILIKYFQLGGKLVLPRAAPRPVERKRQRLDALHVYSPFVCRCTCQERGDRTPAPEISGDSSFHGWGSRDQLTRTAATWPSGARQML